MSHIKIPELPTNTSDRLRLVAKVIRESPEQWDQRLWVQDLAELGETFFSLGDRGQLKRAAGRTNVCKTTACQAGWLVTFAPELPPEVSYSWDRAGAYAGGIESDLADVMFHQDFGEDYDGGDIADWLEALAEIPEGQRTVANALERIPLFRGLAEPTGELDLDDEDENDD